MKTLKKTLSLTLVFAMVFSLMSMAFAAPTATTTTKTTGYTDAASITYKEAADVASAIGVFQGNDSGAFAPTDKLTREQAAKVICYLTMGKAAADKLTTASDPFTDVPAARWSAGSVAYCKQQGIIAGYGDGKFGPTDTVTGYQFAKMLLVALGYDATIEQFNGNDWSVNVAKRAFANKLFSGNSAFVGTNAATREEAALYTYNTLNASTYSYQSKGTNIKTSDGTVINVGAAPAAKTGNTFKGTFYPTLIRTDSTDALGRDADLWKYNGTKIGTYATEADYTFTAAAAGATAKAKVASMGLTGFTVKGNSVATTGNVSATVTSVSDIATLTGNGRLVELYVNGDNTTQIDKVVVNDTYLAKITSINTSTKIVNLQTVAGKSYSVDNDSNPKVYTALSAMAVKDYVLITPAIDGVSIANVALPKTVSGALTSIGTDGTNNTSVTVAGTAYSIAFVQTGLDKLKAANLSSSSKVTMYLDTYGYATYITDTAAASTYFIPFKTSLVTKNGVNVTMATGYTTAGALVSLNIGSQPISVNKDDKAIYVYKYTPSNAKDATQYDSEYTIAGPYAMNTATTPKDETLGATPAGIPYGTYTFSGYTTDSKPITATPYSSDVKFIFADTNTGTVTVKSGVQQVPTGTKAIGFYTADAADASKIYVSCVIVPAAPVEATSANILFVDSLKSTSTSGSTTTYTYNVYLDGAYQQINSTTDATKALKTFYNYSKNETSGVYTLSAATENLANSEKAVINTVAATPGVTDNLLNVTIDKTPTQLNAANATVIDEGNTGIGSLTELNAAMGKSNVNVALVYNNVTTSANYKTISCIYIRSAEKKSADATLASVTDTTDATKIVFTVNPDKTITAANDGAAVKDLSSLGRVESKLTIKATDSKATVKATITTAGVKDGDTIVVTAEDGTTAAYTFKNAK